MKTKIFAFVALIVFPLLFSGCAGKINNPGLEVGEERAVKVLVVANSHEDAKKGVEVVKKASRFGEKKSGLGVNFVPVKTLVVEKKSSVNREEALYDLIKVCADAKLRRGEGFDIAIRFIGLPVVDVLKIVSTLPIPRWMAVIDDSVRSYIVTKSYDKIAILHEFWHAFILTETHASWGIMSAVKLDLLPGLGIPLFKNQNFIKFWFSCFFYKV